MINNILELLKDYGIRGALVLTGFALLVFIAVVAGITELSVYKIFEIILFLSPLWMPIILVVVFANLWMDYVRTQQIINTEYTLLEIVIPTEITQSPLAMETVLNVMYHTGEPAEFIERYWDGKTNPQFSLEIVSFEGTVRFFVRTRTKLKDFVTAQLYAHYPTVEIQEVDDYMDRLRYDKDTMELFGIETKLLKPDPYPIKTYVEFGLDKETKEEYKVDPINSIIEFMGSLGKGEYCLFQLIIRSHEKKVKGKEDLLVWQHGAQAEVDKILRRDPKTKSSEAKTEEGYPVFPSFSDEERRVADAILRNTAKKPFESGVRIIYMAYKDNFRTGLRNALPTMMRSFESHGLNGFKPIFRTVFVWKWQDPFGTRKLFRRKEIYEAYRWRSYLQAPYERPFYILSAEEVASVFHFPGRVAQTPTLTRSPTKKAGAPSNLPR